MEPGLSGLWLFLEPHVTAFLVNTGLIKILGRLRRNPAERALILTIDRFSKDTEDSFCFIFKTVFEKEEKFKSKFVTRYRSHKEECRSEFTALLTKHGADKEGLEASLDSFFEIFDEYLSQADKRKTSEVAESQQINAMHDTLKEIQKKLNDPQQEQTTVSQDDGLEVRSSSEDSVGIPDMDFVGTSEFNGSKYKSRADAIKVSMDERQFKAAKQMCLTLISDLEADSEATSLMKFWIYRKTAICSRKLAQNPEASEFHDKAYDAVGPVCVEALCGKAEACWLRGKPEEGLDVIDTALKMDAENKDCLHLKGSLLIAAGRPDEAIKLYEELNDGTET